MKIFVNDKFEIKAINEYLEDDLTMIEIDRAEVFGNMSDFMILNYCYKVIEDGYEIYPIRNFKDIFDEDLQNRISTLEKENIKLKESQSEQDTMIQSTQDAVDFILLGEIPMKLKNINLGGKSMANYIALRIIQKGEVSEKAGQDYYVTFLTNSKYARFKDEVDIILKASGNENLIVDLTSL